MPRERPLTITQAAEHLQVNKETIRRWIRSGELKATLLGYKSGYRIDWADLEAFIASRGQRRNGGGG
jgi:excisionase family DNA binding protein